MTVTRHLTEEQLVLHHYGDVDTPAEAAAIEEHLFACEACRASLEAVRWAIAAADSLPVPDRPEGYGTEVWLRIQPRLERRARWREVLESLWVPQRLALAGGLAVLLVAAFVAGRSWRQPAPAAPVRQANGAAAGQTAAATADRVRDRVLLLAVGDHLERSQMALVELVNAGDGKDVNISAEQERARELVSENRLYRQTAVRAGENGVASVLDDLERVLVEVANSPSTLTTAEFENVRERIEAQGIIFKVRVLGQRVREREARPATTDSRPRLTT
jgi:hypothetical protein